MPKGLGKRMTTSRNIVSVPKQGWWKAQYAEARMDEGEKAERNCSCEQHNKHPSVSTNVTGQVLRHRVRTLGLPSKVLGFWVGAHGWKPKRKEHSPGTAENPTTQNTRHKTPTEGPGATGAHAGRSKVFLNLFLQRGSGVGALA